MSGAVVEAVEAPLESILAMRERYRREMACQIVHDSWHARGFTRSYLLRVGDDVAGYGSVGGAPRDAKDTVKELWVQPAHRGRALPLFRALVAAAGARWVEAQTNDPLLLLMLLDCGREPSSDTILFADGVAARLDVPGAAVRRIAPADRVFEHTHEPVGEWGVELGGEIVATGGFTTYYNPPYADLFMEVAEAHRRRGLGSLLVRELKRICYEAGHLPAARCNGANVASRRTLERAGMFPCARILRARLAG